MSFSHLLVSIIGFLYTISAAAQNNSYVLLGNLRQGVVTQTSFNKENTVYEITQNLSLQNRTIKLPKNSVLKFKGGSLRDGKIIGNNTTIDAPLMQIFQNVEIEGTWIVDKAYCEWFGGGDNTPDCTNSIKQAAKLYATELVFSKGTYNVSSELDISFSNVRINQNARIKAIKPIKHLFLIDASGKDNNDFTGIASFQKGRYMCGGGIVDCNGFAKIGVAFKGGLRTRLENISIVDATECCLKPHLQNNDIFGHCYVTQCQFYNTTNNPDVVAIYSNGSDNEYTQLEIVNFKIGIQVLGSCTCRNIHAWIATPDFASLDNNKVWAESTLFYFFGAGNFSCVSCEADTMRYLCRFVSSVGSNITVSDARVFYNSGVIPHEIVRKHPQTVLDGNNKSFHFDLIGGYYADGTKLCENCGNVKMYTYSSFWN